MGQAIPQHIVEFDPTQSAWEKWGKRWSGSVVSAAAAGFDLDSPPDDDDDLDEDEDDENDGHYALHDDAAVCWVSANGTPVMTSVSPQITRIAAGQIMYENY